MKGLMNIPRINNLKKVYMILHGPTTVEEKKLALWSQWSRFDPRLGEILVDYFLTNWQKINPLILNSEIKKQPWPAALGVLLEHTQLKFKLQDLKISQDQDFNLFVNWKRCTTCNLPIANFEQYFIGINAFAGKQIRKITSRPIHQYLKWGYLENSILINKYSEQKRFTFTSKAIRLQVLNTLIKSKNCINVDDYLQALNYNISRRQAQRDLAECKSLKAKSYTRGRYYKRTY